MSNIRDVSKRSGVSVATVSRAFSSPDKVSEEARAKVFAAAEEIGYKPNHLSKIFRSNRTDTIVVMVPDLANPFFSRVLLGIEKVAAESGLSTLLSDTRDDPKIERSCIDLVHTRRADGLIQLGSSTLSDLGYADLQLPPFVHAIENPEQTVSPSVCIDNVSACEAIVDYLISLGHKKIGVIGGQMESQITRRRLDGYRKAMNKADLPVDDDLIVYGDYSLASGAQAAQKILSRARRVTALFCMSDDIAIGAMSAAQESGIRVPDELSITGFDNIEYGRYVHPALTTVTQSAEMIGKVAMELMAELLSDSTIAPRRHLLPTELVVRKSVAPPRN